MNKILFAIIYTIIFSLSINVYATTTPSNTPPATKAEKSILDSILPNTKNCQYASLEKGKGGLYQPFSGIDDKFPGAKGILKMIKGKDGQTDCVNVGGGATESLVTLTFKTAILIIIVLTIISISISGIQYMTEEATGQIKGGARKRLTNSFIALGLGLLSYTILYTVNKQLVEFSFDPSSIDKDKSIQRGVSDAAAAFSTTTSLLSGNTAAIDPIIAPVTSQGNPNYVPAANWVNPYNPTSIPGTTGSFMDTYNNYGMNTSGVAQSTIQAKIFNINNATLARATAEGVLSLNGITYNFRSGGGGNGYLPFGTYTITNCRTRNDVSSMMVDGFGFSCDLNDSFDARTNAQRTLLRIHPDGGGPGTIGCIGIVGDGNTQRNFFNNITSLLSTNGGRYTITVGQ